MSEKIISVKSGTIKTKDDNEWVELLDQEDKTHRIFPSMQKTDDTWVHLEKEIDAIKEHINSGTIAGKAYKLLKEKKGTFWNVVSIVPVQDVFVKQAQAQVADTREASIEAQVAIKEIGECWRVGKEIPANTLLLYWAWILDKLNTGGKDVKTPKEVSDKEMETKPVTATSGVDDSGRDELIEEILRKVKELGRTGKETVSDISGLFTVDVSRVTSVKQALNQLTTAQLKLFLAGLKNVVAVDLLPVSS